MLPTPPPSPKPSVLCSPEDRLGQILAGQYQLTEILGVGAYGTVYKARDVRTNVYYAVKALNKLGLDHRQRTFQDREIELHFRASGHSNVVSMQKVLDSQDCTFVVLEYCSEGDLFAKITEEGDYIGNDNKAKAVFIQILDALQYCHMRGIFHRDLKPENILVKNNGWTVKLADFGLATQDRITSHFGCGSTFYMSPECQQSHPKPFACYDSEANDVWSLGVILVNLTCGRNPWKRAAMDDSTFRAFMRNRDFLQTILPISDGLNAVLQRIFESDPKQRVSLGELRQLILDCPQLGQDSADASAPPTPPYSPAEKPIDSALAFYGNGPEPVPTFDPLPVQQFPQYPTVQFNSPRPSFTAGNLATPPGSARGSPRQNLYTYQPKPAPPVFCGTFASGASYMPSFSSWSRCSNFVPNFANQACFRNVLVS